MVKFSCKRKKNYYGPGGEKAHMSPKRQGSHRVENKTLFNVRIYVDISQGVTACLLGTRFVSSFSDAWSQTLKRVIFRPLFLCLCSRILWLICSLFLA